MNVSSTSFSPVNREIKMLAQRNHFYSPYNLPFLAFLPEQDNNSNYLNSPSNESDYIYQDVDIMSSMELHSQTLNPLKSFGIILPIGLTFSTSSFFIQTRTLAMLKEENSVNNKLMVTQAKMHMVFWPTLVVATMLTDNIYPLTAYIPPEFCTILSFFWEYCGMCIILYSFYAALLRYIFCLHTQKALKFGKEKLIKLIYWIFYSHAFLWALYTKFIRFNLETIPLLNRCYGWMDRVYLMELHSSTNMVKRHFCAFDSENGGSNTFNVILCTANNIVGVLVWFNLPEFFIYRAIYKWEMQGNKERLKNFGKSLSITSRQYRAKRITVNVKVNALSYIVEMLGGMIIAALAFLRHAHILYTVGMIWYGNIIPSCYLINFSDTKKSILEEGWATGLSKLYKKKEPRKPGESENEMKMKRRPKTSSDNSNNDLASQECREISSEPISGETHQETESVDVGPTDSTTTDDLSPISDKQKSQQGENAIKTTTRDPINHDGLRKESNSQNQQVILHDLEDTRSSSSSKYTGNKSNVHHGNSNYDLPDNKLNNCSIYHIS